MQLLPCVEYDHYMVVEDASRKSITVYSDLNQLEQEFLAKAPEDEKIIKEFIGVAKNLLVL